MEPDTAAEPHGAIDLYWIPLGAGAHVVRISGTLFEACSALLRRRPRCDLYHSALVVHVPEGRFVVEQAPVVNLDTASRGVVAVGPVGARCAGRFRVFRYEVRRWRDGEIPDVRAAIGSPVRVSDSLARSSAESSTCSRPCRHRSGVETSSTPARCGTRTPSSRGRSPRAGWTSPASDRHPADGRRAGTPASSCPDGRRPGHDMTAPRR